MKHDVKVYKVRAGKGFLTHHTQFPTAEKAYEHYERCIKAAKQMVKPGEEFMVIRYNNGDLMTMESVQA